MRQAWTGGSLAKVIGAASAYFGVVFAVGFLLGTVRTLWLVPVVGERNAELMETPIMLAVIYFSARWLVRRFHLSRDSLTDRIAVGAVALSLLVLVEVTVVLALRGLTLRAYLSSRDPLSGLVYVASLLVFAALPPILGAVEGA